MKYGFFLLFFLLAVPLYAEDITVAAASDLNFAIKEIINVFESDTGHKVRLTLGSSGNFYAQIVNGAPFDVFLSADVSYPKRLEQTGHAISGSTFVYGIGRIALWVPARSGLNLEKLRMHALMDRSINKIAIANPEHAPYGRASVAAMKHANVYEVIKGKLVLGENISQAAQFVQSGAADIGIIALSIALSDPMRKAGRHWSIPADSYPRLEQGAALLNRSGTAARAFHEWLRGPTAKQVFKTYGFE